MEKCENVTKKTKQSFLKPSKPFPFYGCRKCLSPYKRLKNVKKKRDNSMLPMFDIASHLWITFLTFSNVWHNLFVVVFRILAEIWRHDSICVPEILMVYIANSMTINTSTELRDHVTVLHTNVAYKPSMVFSSDRDRKLRSDTSEPADIKCQHCG